jgi:hypothetical protein
MKNWKQRTFSLGVFLGLVAIIAFGFAFVACDDGNGKDEQPKFRETTINLFEGETKENGQPYTAKVQGTLLEAEWNGVAEKIKVAINGKYESYVALETTGGDAMASAYKEIFDNGIIIVEKTSEYTNWKTTTDGKTMYLNFAVLDNDLEAIIHAAFGKMYENTAGNG